MLKGTTGYLCLSQNRKPDFNPKIVKHLIYPKQAVVPLLLCDCQQVFFKMSFSLTLDFICICLAIPGNTLYLYAKCVHPYLRNSPTTDLTRKK